MGRQKLTTICVAALVACGCLVINDSAFGQNSRRRLDDRVTGTRTVGINDYRSRNFLIHTDLSPEEAQKLLEELETMLGIISRYWGQPNRKTIECYIVDNISAWPRGSLPDFSIDFIRGEAGVTRTQAAFSGPRLVDAKAIVYAVNKHGTPLHEAVHAYCGQNFGHTGPLWYSEGMAEMGAYWSADEQGVQLPDIIVRYLQNTEIKSFNAIINSNERTGDSWQNYSWRWALCHLLAYNPNYSKRFRVLGLNLLMDRNDSFEKSYGVMAKEIEFEYRQFIENIENGYRSDLAAWDWKARFRPLLPGRKSSTKVKAQAGWQPSRIAVRGGTTYRVTSSGEWSVSEEGDKLSPDGDESGAGKLMGVLFNPVTYELGEPFELGTEATFTPGYNAQLYFRCRDNWGSLADNSGTISVLLQQAD
ncbi:hypothetical protein [Calycomorphotria hydatis]|uniref:DUF1570 domain-containing protein n=1 Tax=Calycomorphotria hydatis TaxID=2528027 RepID=A0A517TAX2_9PLAN|nr:hypothetical protein [Calycomorphotria hydatis]QDT65521.1 hypothetical protein V22_27760 [Calycomorphotria hydatis]